MKSLDFLYETPAIAYNRRLPFLNEWLAACGGKASEVKFRCIYEDWNDIISDETVDMSNDQINFAPDQCRWITNQGLAKG